MLLKSFEYIEDYCNSLYRNQIADQSFRYKLLVLCLLDIYEKLEPVVSDVISFRHSSLKRS